MRKTIFLVLLACITLQAYSQDNPKYHQFSTGINVLSGVFKNAEINNEFMLNNRIGITFDLGYQFSTSAGKNLNLLHNKIEGYYGRIGPRLYFANHDSRAAAYVSGGYVYSYFKQSASIDESDFYEPFAYKISTEQKLDGSYIGIGTLMKMSNSFTLDFGSNFSFFGPQSIRFAQDYNNATNAQPGFGNFIFKGTNNVGLGIGIYCSFKYAFIKH